MISRRIPLAHRTRPRRQRRGTVAALKRKLWSLFSVYVLKRDNFVCFTCGRPANQAGHFYSRRIASIWIDPKNVHAQDSTCNFYLHGNPGAYAERIIRDYGPEELARLTHRANRVTKQWKREELEALIACLQRGGPDFELRYYEVNL